jgi:hypothetical protein
MLKDYTTTVAVHTSMAEIQRALVRGGARAIAQSYDANGRVTGLEFTLPSPAGMSSYALPVRPDRVAAVLKEQRAEPRYRTDQHVEKVAWRILRDWVLAQLAIMETQMVSLPEIMLPFMRTEGGATVFELYDQGAMRALTAGG